MEQNKAESAHESLESVNAFNGNLHAKLWPYEGEQREKCKELLVRLIAWKPLFDQLISYFQSFEQSYSTMNKETKKLGAKLFANLKNTPLDAVELSSPLQVFVDAVANQNDQTARNIQVQLVDQCKQLQAKHLNDTKELRLKITKLLESMTKERKKALKTMQSHIQQCQQVKVNKTSDKAVVDPWLTEATVKHEVRQIVQFENESRLKLHALHSEARMLDVSLLAEFKKLMHAFLSVQSVHLGEMKKHLANVENVLQGAEDGHVFDEYCRKQQLIDAACFKPDLTIESFPWPQQLKEQEQNKVLLDGVLERPGSVKTSHFRPSYFVLTENGFLHCFKVKSSSTLDNKYLDEIKSDPSNIKYSIYLRTPRINIMQSLINVNCIDIIVPEPKGGLFQSKNAEKEVKYLIKANSEHEMNQWIEAISKFLSLNRARPDIEE
ncbi:hypothetical protein MIR68_009418 [Amoeboaphelidium protococcarum]|nr:hypothetical protein MIR68_009418 [Amoeboaphelidium protococcarum]